MRRLLVKEKLAIWVILSVFAAFSVTQAEAQEDKKPIKIGVTCALTGVHAPVAGFCYGEMDYYTYLNETQGGIAGHLIEATLYDGAETPQELTAYKKMAPYVHSISLYSTMANKALRKEINEIDKISTITGGMDDRIISPYQFLVGPSYQQQFYITFKRMAGLGAKTVAISHGDFEWMVEMPKDVIARKLPEKAGIKIAANVEHVAKSTEVTAEMARIKRANPDAIFLWGGNPTAPVAGALSLGIPAEKLFECHWYTLPLITDMFGEKVNGMRGWLMLPSVDMVMAHPELRVAKELKEFFADHKPYTRNWTYIRGWLIGTIRAEAIRRALEKTGNVIPDDIKKFRTMIRDELEGIKGFDLGVGYGFEPVDYSDHMGWGGMMPAIVKNGKWVPEGEYQSFK